MVKHRTSDYELNAECDDGVMLYWISIKLIYILITNFVALLQDECSPRDTIS
jgi:hypothetical protein